MIFEFSYRRTWTVTLQGSWIPEVLILKSHTSILSSADLKSVALKSNRGREKEKKKYRKHLRVSHQLKRFAWMQVLSKLGWF